MVYHSIIQSYLGLFSGNRDTWSMPDVTGLTPKVLWLKITDNIFDPVPV